jgi:hypothetical protein
MHTHHAIDYIEFTVRDIAAARSSCSIPPTSEASLAAVRAAGGSILQQPFAFPGGRRFHFLDPSGNELAVWATE